MNKENDKISQISPYYEIILGLKYTNLQKILYIQCIKKSLQNGIAAVFIIRYTRGLYVSLRLL